MKIYLTDAREIRDLDTDEDFICMWDKSVHYDADMDAYPMTKDQFEWWEELLERKAHCDDMMDKLDAETANEIFDDCAFECAYYYLFIDRLEKALKKECAKRKYMRRVSYAA